MDYESIVDVFQEAGVTKITRSGPDHVAVQCVLAPFSQAHRFSPDFKGKGWVRISDDGESWCGCWKCDYKMRVTELFRAACQKSPIFRSALDQALKRETVSRRKEPELPEDMTYKPQDVDYTPIYKKTFRQNIKKLMPWEWLKAKGVTPKGTKAFQIGLDLEQGSIIFPCITREGKVVGAQSRAVAENSSENKYTSILKFRSGDHFLGEHLSGTDGLLPPNEVAVFEGPMDAIHAYEMGVNNSLAAFGSKLKLGQLKLLKSWGIDTIWLMLDPDEAGIKGTESSRALIGRYCPEIIVLSAKLPDDPKYLTKKQYRTIFTTREKECQANKTQKSMENLLERLAAHSRQMRKS